MHKLLLAITLLLLSNYTYASSTAGSCVASTGYQFTPITKKNTEYTRNIQCGDTVPQNAVISSISYSYAFKAYDYQDGGMSWLPMGDYVLEITANGLTTSQTLGVDTSRLVSIGSGDVYSDIFSGSPVDQIFSITYFLDTGSSLQTSTNQVDLSGFTLTINWDEVTKLPVPASAFLFAPALIGFMGVRGKAQKS